MNFEAAVLRAARELRKAIEAEPALRTDLLTAKQVEAFWRTFAHVIPNGPFVGYVDRMLLLTEPADLARQTNLAFQVASNHAD